MQKREIISNAYEYRLFVFITLHWINIFSKIHTDAYDKSKRPVTRYVANNDRIISVYLSK